MQRFNTPFPVILCSALILLLAVCLLSGLDHSLFLQLNTLSQRLPDWLWGFLTTLSDPIVAPLIVFSLFYRKPLFLRAFFIAILLALVCNYSLKHGFAIERPSSILNPENFNAIGPAISSPSFPSGHTLTIFTMMALISCWFQKRSVTVVVFSLAAIISFSRIGVGAHWPSDVLFGALIGCFIGWLAIEINSRLGETIPEKLLLSGFFIALFAGILSLINKTPYSAGQWLATAAALFTIAYALKSITELLHRQKG